MSEEANSNPSKICPECGKSLASAAILCIDCGYHFQHQRRLQTAIDLPTTSHEGETFESDSNPYAPPRSAHTDDVRDSFELTEADANWARVIVSDAEYMPWLFIASLCCCAIPMPLMFPYYSYRLMNWTNLDARFPELHNPNSFSPHGQLAAEFQEARFLLVTGMIVGAIFYVVAFIFGIVTLLD